ncbi:MAG: hypothetical protein C0467_15890 [Planctomycetaceae bacterium]|nr:hypothetical protein [Planctomycetaceae bacterium]
MPPANARRRAASSRPPAPTAAETLQRLLDGLRSCDSPRIAAWAKQFPDVATQDGDQNPPTPTMKGGNNL